MKTLEQSKKSDNRIRKSKLGQFFTPRQIARFMADMFVEKRNDKCRLLDAGAGRGVLAGAFLEKWMINLRRL